MAAVNKKARWIAGVLLAAASLLHFGAAAYYWFFGGGTWYILGIKVRLHQWDKPWLLAMALWTAAVLVRPGGFFPARLFRLVFDPWRSRAESFARPWAVAGAALGAGIGWYLTVSYHYLFPSLLAILPTIALGTALGAGLHGGAALLTAAAVRREDDAYRQGLMQGLYALTAAALIYGPLRRWEGFFCDPLWPFGGGALLAMAVVWGIAGLSRLGLLRGRRGLGLGAAVVVGLVLAMTVSHVSYRRSRAAAPPRDRVLVITLDTTRADHLSAYGYYRKTSPNIDRVAAGGARFQLAICAMGTTDPSHASMFTGAYPRTHGSVDVGFPIVGKVSSLPEYLAERGFRTACVTSRWRLDPSGVLNLPGFEDEYVLRGLTEQTSAPTAFRRAANWLSNHRADDVFLWVHFFDPHQTYKPHRDFPLHFSDDNRACDPDRLLPRGEYVSAREVQACVDLYDGEIAYMDYWVGRLLQYVDELEPKSRRPPLVVLLADHGEILGEYQDRPIHYGFGHGDVIYHQVAWIPFIMSWPGTIKPAVVGGVTETVDLAPTLVDYLFGRNDFRGQGRDLRPVIEGREPPDQTGIIQRSLREDSAGRYRYEPNYGLYRGLTKLKVFANGATELYNLDLDPREELEQSLLQPQQTQEMKNLFDRWKKDTPETKPKELELDANERSILRALGYVQ